MGVSVNHGPPRRRPGKEAPHLQPYRGAADDDVAVAFADHADPAVLVQLEFELDVEIGA